MANIVIVGAGPVGLWTAIQIKKRNPALDIQMYEKHDVYQRSHVLKLDYWSMLLYGRQAKSDREKQFYDEVTGKSLTKIITQATKSIFIRTNDLESSLKSFALDLGIKIDKKNILSVMDAEELHPECERFLAGDGAKSNMRQQLLGETSLTEIELQHIVEVKYQVSGKACALNPLWDHFKTNKTHKHMAFEYVGKEKAGVSPVTLRFFLDKDTYQSLPEASFKAPLTLEAKTLPISLQSDIESYIKIREKASASLGENEAFIAGSAKISKLTLSLYAAKEFSIKRGDKTWFLVGDAAMGVPYFRALNSGMILGSRLAQIMCGKFLGVNIGIDKQILLYNIHRPMHIATEFAIARGKNMGLQSYDWFRKMTAELFPPEWDSAVEANTSEIYAQNSQPGEEPSLDNKAESSNNRARANDKIGEKYGDIGQKIEKKRKKANFLQKIFKNK